jgi:hypothetical protein
MSAQPICPDGQRPLPDHRPQLEGLMGPVVRIVPQSRSRVPSFSRGISAA